MSSFPFLPLYPVTSICIPIIVSFGLPIRASLLTQECAPSAPQITFVVNFLSPFAVKISIITLSCSISNLVGLLDNQSSAPASIACITTASSNSFLQTDQVRIFSSCPISTNVPSGLYILAPQIGVNTVSGRFTDFIAFGFTKPAH